MNPTLSKEEKAELRRMLREALPTRDQFIRENFYLAGLKKAGFITNTKDMDYIEQRIKTFFGLKSIFDYAQLMRDVDEMKQWP